MDPKLHQLENECLSMSDMAPSPKGVTNDGTSYGIKPTDGLRPSENIQPSGSVYSRKSVSASTLGQIDT